MEYFTNAQGKQVPNPKTKEDILELLKNQAYLERGICAIFEKQTLSEQVSGETAVLNGVGFSGAHSKLGSYLAKWILKGRQDFNKHYGRNLSGKHLEKANKFMPRYAGQLLEMSKKHIAKIQKL